MRVMRRWSVRHSRGLKLLYSVVELTIRILHPVIRRVGYERMDKPVLAIEKVSKGMLLDSQSCGQCIVGDTGLSCPMNCPKSLRNGPCGGVRANGKCEVDATLDCVWVLAWQGNKNMRVKEYPIQFVQPPIDNRLIGTSAWLRKLREKRGEKEVFPVGKR